MLPYLACPLCRQPLAAAGLTLRCRDGHAFDVARQGYASLLTGRAPAGDTADMVTARVAFLEAGHFSFLTEALAQTAAEVWEDLPGCVLDVGGGTGHHLAAVLDRLGSARGRMPAGVVLDASKPALRRAARSHPRVGAVAADAWGVLPLRDAAAGLGLVVFAPRNPAELARVLHPRGFLLVVVPTRRHLRELSAPLGLLDVDPHKDERLAEQLSRSFTLRSAAELEQTMVLGRAEVVTLARMGPSARHTTAAALALRAAALPEPVAVTASVRVAAYRPQTPIA